MSRFSVGQRVVCVKNGSISGLVKDRIYTIIEVKHGCKCSEVYYVGIESARLYSLCPKCGHFANNHNNGKYWHAEYMFAPITEADHSKAEIASTILDQFKEVRENISKPVKEGV